MYPYLQCALNYSTYTSWKLKYAVNSEHTQYKYWTVKHMISSVLIQYTYLNLKGSNTKKIKTPFTSAGFKKNCNLWKSLGG